jgi:hypothetical protein
LAEYQHLTEDELLNLAEERDQLTDEARLTLDTELARRKLSIADIESYRLQRNTDDKEDKLRRPQYIPRWGLGKKFLGKTNHHRDASEHFEVYDSTLWFVVLWFPVFPIATYSVRRDLERWWGGISASNEIPIERHPRNWEQIFLTWIKTMLVLWVVILLFNHPEWLRHLAKAIPRIS